jgi:hypothetical protein
VSAPASDQVPVITATAQLWKLGVGGALLIGGAALGWVAERYAGYGSDMAAVLIPAACWVMAAISILYAARAVRCPQCGLRWVSWSMRTQPFTQWLFVVVGMPACPTCGLSSQTLAREQPNKSLERSRDR